MGSSPITYTSLMHWVLTPRGMKRPQCTKTVGSVRPLERGGVVFYVEKEESMPHKESDDSRVISVRLPNPLVQRLDRVLDGQTTHRRRPATRNAAMRDALQGWLDHQEQLAGLLE